jgi:hypothetical protein
MASRFNLVTAAFGHLLNRSRFLDLRATSLRLFGDDLVVALGIPVARRMGHEPLRSILALQEKGIFRNVAMRIRRQRLQKRGGAIL